MVGRASSGTGMVPSVRCRPGSAPSRWPAPRSGTAGLPRAGSASGSPRRSGRAGRSWLEAPAGKARWRSQRRDGGRAASTPFCRRCTCAASRRATPRRRSRRCWGRTPRTCRLRSSAASRPNGRPSTSAGRRETCRRVATCTFGPMGSTSRPGWRSRSSVGVDGLHTASIVPD